jgi:hypothetical protein
VKCRPPFVRPRRAPLPLDRLAALPLDHLVPLAVAHIRSAPLDELGPVPRGSPRTHATLDEIAELVVARPGVARELAAVLNPVLLRAAELSGGNVSAAAPLLSMERMVFARRSQRGKRSS